MIPAGQAFGAAGLRVYVATAAVDGRKSFDTLCEVVRTALGHDPLGGDLFVFRNRRANRVKVLFFDGNGLVLYAKNLETEDTRPIGRTERHERANNQHIGLAGAGRMVGISRRSGTRRSVMPQHGGASVPPRARRPREPYRSSGSGGS